MNNKNTNDDGYIFKAKYLNPKLEKIFKIVFAIIVLLAGLMGLIDKSFDGTYYAGAIFFLSGIFITLNDDNFNLIFLFSHGFTGLCLMLYVTVYMILKSPALTDSANNITMYLIISIAMIITGFISTILYNLNYKVRDYKYSLPIILLLFLIGILMIKFLPTIYGIDISQSF